MNSNDSRPSEPRRASARKSLAQGRSPRQGDAAARRYPADAGDSRAKPFSAAEHSLAEAYAHVIAAGIDPEAVDIPFTRIADSIAGAQARRHLTLAPYSARHRKQDCDTAVRPVIPDMPGFNWCPDPGGIQTAAEFMDVLRKYRLWAGNPSFRAMQRQCDHRFAASTICAAMQGDGLPSLDMTDAIIVACGGREEHRQAFATAWRSLMLSRHDAVRGRRPSPVRALHPVT
jgi:hypothetical protein